jgi:hypothetical protein
LVGKIRRVRFLTSDVALMHVVGGMIMAGQTDIEPERKFSTDSCGYERQKRRMASGCISKYKGPILGKARASSKTDRRIKETIVA